jgi:hypothetical protein
MKQKKYKKRRERLFWITAFGIIPFGLAAGAYILAGIVSDIYFPLLGIGVGSVICGIFTAIFGRKIIISRITLGNYTKPLSFTNWKTPLYAPWDPRDESASTHFFQIFQLIFLQSFTIFSV